MKIYKSSPTRPVIYKYWKTSPLFHSLNKQAFDGECNKCMACGVQGTIDRAHIVAKVNGGSYQPSNLHCLCQVCHKISENLEGHDYWLWIAIKSRLFSYGTDMTIEMDWASPEDETLKVYCYQSAYPNKLMKYSKEYSELSLLEGWPGRMEISYLYLTEHFKNNFVQRLDINYPHLEEIEEVLEIQEDGIHKNIVALDAQQKEMKI